MNDHFYKNLPRLEGSLKPILRTPDAFVAVPDDWRVIVSDIQGSTKATFEGHGRDINTLAASCVIACLNVAKKHGVEIPFLYGGDGATMLVPKPLCDEMIESLKSLRANAHKTYGLRLRVGFVAIAKIYEKGEQLRIAKWAVSPKYNQAIFLGNGLAVADKIIKADPDTGHIPETEMAREVDLDGLKCRWNPIAPLQPKEEVVCAIIESRKTELQGEVYAEVLEAFDYIYGEYHDRHPVAERFLSPSLSLANMRRRILLSQDAHQVFAIADEIVRSFVNIVVFGLGQKFGRFDPKKYLHDLVLATDTLHVSGNTMYTIISGTKKQRTALREALDTLEKSGKIFYGLASCPSSVMTCYVQRHDEGHHHFLDGSEGGYTLAAKEWKEKRKTI